MTSSLPVPSVQANLALVIVLPSGAALLNDLPGRLLPGRYAFAGGRGEVSAAARPPVRGAAFSQERARCQGGRTAPLRSDLLLAGFASAATMRAVSSFRLGAIDQAILSSHHASHVRRLWPMVRMRPICRANRRPVSSRACAACDEPVFR